MESKSLIVMDDIVPCFHLRLRVVVLSFGEEVFFFFCVYVRVWKFGGMGLRGLKVLSQFGRLRSHCVRAAVVSIDWKVDVVEASTTYCGRRL